MPRNLNMVLDDKTDAILKARMEAWGMSQTATVKLALKLMPARPSVDPENPSKIWSDGND